MFRRRSTLQRRDRESGLVFSWRVPLSSGGSFALAFLLVAGVSVLLAVGVRVRVSEPSEATRGQASLTLVPEDSGGEWLERRAIEAGPFPLRWNPAADPAYAALRSEALRAASRAGMSYRPRLAEIDWAESGGRRERGQGPAQLPPLPDPDAYARPGEGPASVPLGLRLLRSDSPLELLHPGLTVPSMEAGGKLGVRYLVAYGERGDVMNVTRLDSGETDAGMVEWISKSRISGHGGEAGWVVVESGVAR